MFYLDSSIAYQAYGRDLGVDFIYNINTYALKHMPDLTLYLALDPQIGQMRVQQGRSHKVDRLDLETKAFHERVQLGYEAIYQKDPQRVKKIDASGDVQTIYHEVYTLIKASL